MPRQAVQAGGEVVKGAKLVYKLEVRVGRKGSTVLLIRSAMAWGPGTGGVQAHTHAVCGSDRRASPQLQPGGPPAAPPHSLVLQDGDERAGDARARLHGAQAAVSNLAADDLGACRSGQIRKEDRHEHE